MPCQRSTPSEYFELGHLEKAAQVSGVPEPAQGRHLEVPERHVEFALYARAVEAVVRSGRLLQRPMLWKEEGVEEDPVGILGPDGVVGAARHRHAHAGLQVDTDVRKLLDPLVLLQPLLVHSVRMKACQVIVFLHLTDGTSTSTKQISVVHLKDSHSHLFVYGYEQVVGLIVVPPDTHCTSPEHTPRSFQPFRVTQSLLEIDLWNLGQPPHIDGVLRQFNSHVMQHAFQGLRRHLCSLGQFNEQVIQA
mmetsp:Transcript_90319/g.264224  ORF Transcript_90319/g.264224 Transcript_90319/m.264224 type:complete len:248 (+) Transcript_90319:40-783(+)